MDAPAPREMTIFPTGARFQAWLEEHHAGVSELTAAGRVVRSQPCGRD